MSAASLQYFPIRLDQSHLLEPAFLERNVLKIMKEAILLEKPIGEEGIPVVLRNITAASLPSFPSIGHEACVVPSKSKPSWSLAASDMRPGCQAGSNTTST